MYDRQLQTIAQAFVNLSHAMTRLANAQSRLADATEEANEIARTESGDSHA